MGITVSPPAFVQMASDVRGWSTRQEAAATRVVEEAARDATASLASATPRRTGATAAAWTYAMGGGGGRITAVVSISGSHPSGVPFGQVLHWLENGRGPVYPQRKAALMWEGLSHPVRSAGSARGAPFADAAFERAVSGLEEKLVAAVSDGFPL